jgi:hypothetical protein
MHSAVEPVTIPTASPLVPHSGGKPCSTSKPRGVKRNIAKLGGESSITSYKMNFLVLVVQLIVMSEYISSRMTTARSNSPDELANLNDSIRHQLMQLYLKFVQDVHKDWMRRHMKPDSKEILEHHGFVRPRIRNRPCTKRMHVSLQKIVGIILQRCGMSLLLVDVPKL